MRHALLFLLFWFAISSETAWSADPETTAGKTGGVTEISMKRESCLGMCPADELVLSADGGALYAGYSATPRIGIYTGKIDNWTFTRLAAYLVEQEFFEKDAVMTRSEGLHMVPVTFTIVRDGKATKKRLISEITPAGWAIETLMESISSKIDWQPVDSGISGQLVTSFENKDNFWTNLPLPNAIISISPTKNNPTPNSRLGSLALSGFSCRTDKEGRFEINLPSGEYLIQSRYYPLQGKGVAGYEMSVTVLSRGMSPVILSIR